MAGPEVGSSIPHCASWVEVGLMIYRVLSRSVVLREAGEIIVIVIMGSTVTSSPSVKKNPLKISPNVLFWRKN